MFSRKKNYTTYSRMTTTGLKPSTKRSKVNHKAKILAKRNSLKLWKMKLITWRSILKLNLDWLKMRTKSSNVNSRKCITDAINNWLRHPAPDISSNIQVPWEAPVMMNSREEITLPISKLYRLSSLVNMEKAHSRCKKHRVRIILTKVAFQIIIELKTSSTLLRWISRDSRETSLRKKE